MSSDFQEPLREGNEGFNVSLPVFFDSISSSACIQTNSHKYEIQSISSGPCDSILSIDALGSCRMIHLNREIKISSKKTKVNETFEASCASESSWAGITTAANDRTTVYCIFPLERYLLMKILGDHSSFIRSTSRNF